MRELARSTTGGAGARPWRLGTCPGTAQVGFPVRPVAQRRSQYAGCPPVIILAGLGQIGDAGLEQPLQVLGAPLVRLADPPAGLDQCRDATAASDMRLHAASLAGLGASQ